MIIIFEGQNGSGKTPYAKRFSEITGYPLVEFGTIGNAEGLTQKDIALKARCEDGLFCELTSKVMMSNLVVDRLYPSDYVYSKIKKDRTFDIKWYSETIERKMHYSKNKYFIVYLKCNDREELIKRREESNEKFITLGELDEELKVYHEFFYGFTGIPFIEIDTTKREDIDNNISLIINTIKKMKVKKIKNIIKSKGK